MSIGTDDLGRITQKTSVFASDGDRLGTIDQIYTSDTSGDPAWVTLKTGLFGTQESFVPLSDASFDGDDIRVGVTKEAVHGAPRVDAGDHLGPDAEDDLYRHYGLHNPDRPEADAGLQDRTGQDRTGQDRTEQDRTGPARAEDTAAAGRDRDEELAQRDVEGRDEVVDSPGVGSHAAAAEDTPVAGHPAADEQEGLGRDEQEAVRPGERTTRLKRYVVTERVVQTVEELPDDDPR